MHARFFVFGRAFRSSRLWSRIPRPGSKRNQSQSFCRICQHNFSTTTILRKIVQVSRNKAKNAGKENKYDSRLMIYDTGDIRSAWINFWKGTALFQFAATLVIAVPMLYHNEQQPDPNIRLLQAVGVGILGAIPTAAMTFVTAPFVWKVYLNIPEYARHNSISLMSFVRTLPPSSKLEFVTLRALLIPRTHKVSMQDLRALPARRFGLANIEIPKDNIWRQAQKEKGWWLRFREFVKEPRYKFYVKEGRTYTLRTGAPGVWEEVAKKIQEQTVKNAEKGNGSKDPRRAQQSLRLVSKVERPKPLRRQTARPL